MRITPSRLLLIGLMFGLLTSVAPAQAATVKKASVNPKVSTWLGKQISGDGLDANNAFLDKPSGFVADPSCNLIVADTQNNIIRQINHSTNVITRLAGTGQYLNTNGPALKAAFRAPQDVVLGPDGELYVVDTENNSIRILRNGLVTTWLTKLHSPTGAALDGTTLYIADTKANKILKATIPTGTAAVAATIPSPTKIAVLNNSLYVTNSNNTALTRINLTTGVVTPLKTGLQDLEAVRIYNDEVYFLSGLNGTYNAIWRYTPSTGAIVQLQNIAETEWYNHGSDLLFCGNTMYLLFREGASIFASTVTGDSPVKIAGKHRWSDQDGSRNVALVGRPTYMLRSKDGKKLYLLVNHQLKSYDLKTNVLTYLTGYPNDNYVDGVGSAGRFSGVTQFAMSPDGKTLYLADRNNNRIRVFDIATNTLSTLTGAGPANLFGTVTTAYVEGGACPTTLTMGAKGCAYLNRPSGIAISNDGKTLYVADTLNNVIRTVNVATGAVKFLAGSTTKGFKDGVGNRAQFNRPYSLLLSKDGKTLYVVDLNNHAIRQITLKNKNVTTLVGKGRAGYREGTLSSAFLSYPDSLTYGAGNSILLSEVGDHRIRKIDLTKKTISLLAGSGQRGSDNGPATKATFSSPRGMLYLAANTVIVADQGNDMIRAISLK